MLLGRMPTTKTTVKLMPMGDSITYGSHSQDTGGYRLFLYNRLIARGYIPDFVGSQTTLFDTTPDGAHEGYAGYRIDQLTALLSVELAAYTPDVLLFMAGTNDASNADTAATMLSRAASFLTTARINLPSAWVLISTAPLRTDNGSWNTQIQAYNAGLPAVVAAHVSGGGLAALADAGGSLVAANLDTDGIHPHRQGYVTLSDLWLPPLLAVLRENF